MSRFLKNGCIKTSYTKFCYFSTKTNPYVEVLKTLKSWEQDLRSRNKILPQNNEGGKVSNTEYLPEYYSSTNENSNNFNNITHAKSNDVKINSDIMDSIIKKQDQKIPKRFLHYKDEVKLSNVKSSSNNFTSINKDPSQISSIFTEQKHINTAKQLNDHEERSKNEPYRTTINKFKISKTSSFNISDKKVDKSTENISMNPSSGEAFNNFNHNLKNDKIHANYSSNFKDRTAGKKTKSNKSKTDITDSMGKSATSLKHLFNEPPKTKSFDELLSNLNSKHNSDVAKFSAPFIGKKTVSEIATGKETSKTGKKSKTSKKKSQTFSAEKVDQKLKAKQESALQSLKSLIEAYINANEINKAHRTFEYLLHDQAKKKMIDIDLYNLIISGWAREGKLDKVKHLFFLMANDKISPNLQSYAGYLEAISRSKCVDVSEIPKIVDEMKSHGFSHKDLLQNCVFVNDQREKVMEALGFVERDLSLPLYVPSEAYSYKLLEKLNDKNYEKGKSHFNFCFEAKDIPKLTAAQMEMEEKSVIKIKSVNTVTELTDKITKCREYIKECEKVWKKRLTKAINNLKVPKKQQQGILGLSPNQSIYPYLTVVDTEVLVNLLLQETRMLGETAEFYSPNIKHLYKDLGLKVMRHYFMALNKKNNVTEKVHFIYQNYLEYLLKPEVSSQYLPREYWEFLKSKHVDGPTIDISNSNWAYSLLIFIGSIMYDVLRSNICFNPNRINRKSDSNFMYPAFHIVYENHDVKLNRQIRAHDMFAKLYRDAKLEYLEFDVSLVPMLSPPRPWIKYDCGSMLITKVPFIRFPEQARSQSSFYSNVPTQQLNPCFDSLNNLSLCPWIINKPMLDIVIKFFQKGGSEELDIPLDPSNFYLDPKLLETCDINGKSAYKLKLDYEKKKCEMTSLWFDCLYKLSIANHFRDMVFWFPHNLDFRGRVYPTPPHFNHLGSDLSRSILLFAAGKPLGEKGLDWMKIHLVNLTGFKKRASHAERLEYANEILPEILDSADNPFGGNRWWMKSDKPLQTLACCMEVASAVRHPNPAEYISHFPVHQDGSCNGLQHYAALGRDELGAIEVNLHPSSAPQDVYSGVAALVEKERERDANMGVEIAQALEGFVTRKVVKQTVMTFVYGVTSYGARLQVLKQLKDMPEFPEKYHVPAATYLMKKIFLSIKEMFTATKKIQDWFTECAEEITRVTEDAVEWVTPLGLPVIQPYYKETVVRSSKFCLSKGNKENINHYVSHFEPYQLPNVRKQKNAFAPNFIHSLDSTHMMLTSLFCHRKGVTFVSVHDCYWTHASTIKEMNKVCREQFVALHSEPILENLSAFFLERYMHAAEKNGDMNMKQKRASSKMRDVLSAVPDKGSFNLNLVLKSEYFFS